ncbi:MAG: hypothetical protein OYL97_08525 [Candidatus Poribacteria bacterium]|nr:hypothetical protein [Candidatus Poribacteria bacterium]
MPYFIKKPIPIEAVQQTGPFKTQTLEGELEGKAGDYLVTGVNGEQYPVDREIFEKTYYEVTKDVYDDYYNKRE